MKAKIALVLAVTIIAFEAMVMVNSQAYCSRDPITKTSCGVDQRYLISKILVDINIRINIRLNNFCRY